jgi:hypothetical protein
MSMGFFLFLYHLFTLQVALTDHMELVPTIARSTSVIEKCSMGRYSLTRCVLEMLALIKEPGALVERVFVRFYSFLTLTFPREMVTIWIIRESF